MNFSRHDNAEHDPPTEAELEAARVFIAGMSYEDLVTRVADAVWEETEDE